MAPKSLIAILWLSVGLSIACGDDPKPKPKVDKETEQKIEKLITEFTQTDESGMGYSGSVSGTTFLPLDTDGQISTMLLFQAPLKRSDAMRELVKMGIVAVPLLIEHLNDKRPTKIPPLTHSGGFGGMWFNNGCDYNERTQKRPKPIKAEKPGNESPKKFHRLTVGDLCYVTLGQIVNRGFSAVRYQPTANIVVTSPTRSEGVRAIVKEHWGGLTAEKHKASLLEDFNKPDNEYRRIGAAKRLTYYYPDSLEAPALWVLAQPTYDVMDVQKFVREKLYAAKDSMNRKKLFDAYLAGKSDTYREGVLRDPFDDLNTVEANEEGRLYPPLKDYSDQPRLCLVELFNKPKTVKSKEAPSQPDLMESAVMASFIGEGLIYDHNLKIDRAVRDLLVSLKNDDYLATACADRLVGRGCDAEIENYFKDHWSEKPLARLGWTPVHVAVSRGNVEELAELLRKGANAGAAARNGDTPLHLAARAGDTGTLKMLLDARTSSDPKNKADVTPIHVASLAENWDVAKLLADRGAEIPGVLAATAIGQTELVRKFVKDQPLCAGLETISGKTSLHLAAERGYLAIAEVLLSAKAKTTEADKSGMMPLHLACLNGHESMVRLLVTHKADIRKKVGAGLEPLHFAALGGNAKIVAFLLDNGAKIKDKAENGQTAVHFAAMNGRADVINLLLKRGAAVDEPDKYNRTALHASAGTGQTAAAEALLIGKARVDPQADGELSPLQMAIKQGHCDTVALLLRHKANPLAMAAFGGTALQMAEDTGEEEIIKLVREASVKK